MTEGTPGVIAGRYEPLERLGEGGHGEVWEARDRLSGRTVAVKLLHPDFEFSAARAQLEVAALRMRLPGVVELHDDGMEGGRPYLVMERVQGAPFPGRAIPCAWADMADAAAALLETLALVHASSVVHRDLKPANVLVTSEGRIKLLDFGIARRTTAGDARLTERVELLGTPAYMAPEQMRGAADERADLYAVGVMLYEALAGRLPFEGTTWAQLIRARQKKPIPLAQAAPGVPPAVAQVVDQLLAADPEERPRSAAAVLQMLRGEPSLDAPHFPWLGPQRALRALAAAVQAGRSVDLHGPRGVGRTRCLLALQQALGDRRRVVWLAPAEDAFASLSPLLGDLSELADATLREVRAEVRQRVRAALAEGTVILADDAERIDAATLSVLAGCRGDGAIVHAYRTATRPSPPAPRHAQPGDEESLDLSSSSPEDTDVIVLPALREKHLRSLFAGPDRLLHLREDAARALHLRTEGLPARVTEEVTRWVRLGIAHWVRNHLVIQRDTIEALGSGLLLAAPVLSADAALDGVPEVLVDLLAWVTLAWPHTDPALLARAMGKPLFRVEAHLADLVESSLAERSADGTFVPRVPVSAASRWTEERVREAHGALVRLLPAGTPGRLGHLWMRGAHTDADRRGIAAEAAALGERLLDEGRLEAAVATLEQGIRQVREPGAGPPVEQVRLLALWTEAAIELGTPRALDRVLFEICRVERREGLLGRLEELCRAALGTREFTARPLERIDQVAPFEDRRLERVRLSVRALAARHLDDLAAQEAVLREIASALPAGDADAEATLANHLGRLRYRQGRFREAAELHREAAEKAKSPLVKTYSSISGANAYMDAFAFEDALVWASNALGLARSLRHAYHEALAEWILRSLAYRMGTAGMPDLELIDAAGIVGVTQIEGLLALNEAAVAYRSGARQEARSIAARARAVLSTIGEHQGALMASCLLVLLGEQSTPEEIHGMRARALGPLMPGIGLQALALLAITGCIPRGSVPKSQLFELAAAIPREHWEKRMDVLSINECIQALA